MSRILGSEYMNNNNVKPIAKYIFSSYFIEGTFQ